MFPEKAVLCWLATVDASNKPNVSPKEIWAKASEDHLLISDIASARSVRNIRTNPAVCVSMIDIFLQKGFKLEGTAEILAPEHVNYSALIAPLERMTGGKFPIRHVISIHVQRRSSIIAPSYLFYPNRSEEEQRADAYQTYGVQPIVKDGHRK